MAPEATTQPRVPIQAWAGVALCLAPLVILALSKPWIWLVLAAVVTLPVWLRKADAARWRRRASARTGEDIGTFARAFARKGAEPFDPRVIRATWDALTVEFERGGPRVPVRPTDDLDEDFDIENVDVLATAVAKRAGRSAASWEANVSVLDGVRTVADLVRIVSRQPSA